MLASSLDKIVLPYNFTEREYQRPIFETDKKKIVLVWSRRSGKTLTLWNHAIYRALQTPGEYHYMFPTFSQARTVIWDNWEMQACVPQSLVEKKNETMMYYRFKNGSKLQLVGGDNWERLRGTGPIGVTLDEYSEMKAEVYSTLYGPILLQNKGWLAAGFTPKGQNHSFELYNKAVQNPEEYFVHKMKASENPYFEKEDLAKEKERTTEAIYNQEYEVEFLASGIEVFKNVDDCLWEGDLTPNPLHQYKMGVDLAKYNDWTVLTPVDLTTLHVGKQERFNRIDYDIQEAKIETAFFKWNKPRMTIDATGVGTPVVDHLKARLGRKHGVMLEPFIFTENSRMELLQNLALLFEQDKIRIPNDPQLLSELKAFRWSLRFSGKNFLNRRLVMEVPNGCHDDSVMSLALALYGIKDKVKTRYASAAAKELADYQKYALAKSGTRVFDRI